MEDKIKKVLLATVGEHIKTGAPVASGVVCEKCGESSSSVRNRMARLEDEGYLKNVHTSSGRVPTAKAMRFYVNELLELHENILKKRAVLEAQHAASAGMCDEMLFEIAGLFFHICGNSEYRVIPRPEKTEFGRMKLVLEPGGAVSGIISGSSGPVKSFRFNPGSAVSQKFLDGVCEAVNGELKGAAMSGITGNPGVAEKFLGSRRAESEFISSHWRDFFDTGAENESPGTDSASNIQKALDAVMELAGKADKNHDEKE